MSNDEQVEPKSPATGEGDAFFARAEQVAETGNWDFAIDMYLKGIRRDPDNIDSGHKPLREVSLKRTALGGKAAGLMDKLKARPGKDPLENLVKAEGMLAKEPGSLEQMMGVLKAARDLELPRTVLWIARVLIEAQRLAKKRSKRALIDTALALAAQEDFNYALEACDLAREADPDDGAIPQMISEYSTKYTIIEGRYGEEGDFTKGVKDLDRQKELAQEDSMVKDRRFLEAQAEKARAEYMQSPTTPGKINAYVEALLRLESDTEEDQAIEVLNKAFEATGSYQFRMRIGDVKIRQMTRKWRDLKDGGRAEEAKKQARLQLAFELEEYAERAVNYPTDLSIKYELGKRQYLGGRYDDAIGSLQHASNDPRRRLQAMNYLGQAFAKKTYYREAAETFRRALEGDVPEIRTKELLYNLGDVLEQMGNTDEARDAFSHLAQIDYQYKDVRDRLERLQEANPAGSDAES